jgi:hypothetical protein
MIKASSNFMKMTLTAGIYRRVENIAHFGLGKVNKVDSVVVKWPNGKSKNCFM